MMRNIVGTRAEAPVVEQRHNCFQILSFLGFFEFQLGLTGPRYCDSRCALISRHMHGVRVRMRLQRLRVGGGAFGYQNMCW